MGSGTTTEGVTTAGTEAVDEVSPPPMIPLIIPPIIPLSLLSVGGLAPAAAAASVLPVEASGTPMTPARSSNAELGSLLRW